MAEKKKKKIDQDGPEPKTKKAYRNWLLKKQDRLEKSGLYGDIKADGTVRIAAPYKPKKRKPKKKKAK